MNGKGGKKMEKEFKGQKQKRQNLWWIQYLFRKQNMTNLVYFFFLYFFKKK